MSRPKKPSKKPSRLLKTAKPFPSSTKKEVSSHAIEHEAPADFHPIIQDTSLDNERVSSAANRIRAALNAARERFTGKNKGQVLVHEYSPKPAKSFRGEVDGEWRLDGVRGEATKELLHAMLEAFLPMEVSPRDRAIELGEGYWITVGTRFHGKSEFDDKTGQWDIDPTEDHYRRHEGMLDVSSNYRRTSSARVNSAFFAILQPSSKNRNPMWKNIEKKFKHKVSQVYVRINWNPADVQPKR